MPNPSTEQVMTEKRMALNALRDPALESLLLEGREAAFTSQLTRSDRGLEIKTTDDKTKNTTEALVKAGACSPGLFKSTADVQIIDWNKKTVEKGHIEISQGFFDRDDQFHLNVTRTDASGKVVQTDVGDYNQLDHGHVGTTTEVDYTIHDPKFAKIYGDLKMNQVVSHIADGRDEYRSVVRDGANRVLGIVDQVFDTDAGGDLTAVHTSARKSHMQGQIIPPEQ